VRPRGNRGEGAYLQGVECTLRPCTCTDSTQHCNVQKGILGRGVRNQKTGSCGFQRPASGSVPAFTQWLNLNPSALAPFLNSRHSLPTAPTPLSTSKRSNERITLRVLTIWTWVGRYPSWVSTLDALWTVEERPRAPSLRSARTALSKFPVVSCSSPLVSSEVAAMNLEWDPGRRVHSEYRQPKS